MFDRRFLFRTQCWLYNNKWWLLVLFTILVVWFCSTGVHWPHRFKGATEVKVGNHELMDLSKQFPELYEKLITINDVTEITLNGDANHSLFNLKEIVSHLKETSDLVILNFDNHDKRPIVFHFENPLTKQIVFQTMPIYKGLSKDKQICLFYLNPTGRIGFKCHFYQLFRETQSHDLDRQSI